MMNIFDVFQSIHQIFIDLFPGFITEQSVAAANFVVGIVVASPFLILVALFIWAIVKQSADNGGYE